MKRCLNLRSKRRSSSENAAHAFLFADATLELHDPSEDCFGGKLIDDRRLGRRVELFDKDRAQLAAEPDSLGLAVHVRPTKEFQRVAHDAERALPVSEPGKGLQLQ